MRINNRLDLNKREFGSWFAPFEHELIWVKNQEHIGWVVHVSNIAFKLHYTPFFKQCKNFTYIAPSPELMPPENMCIEIKPLKIVRKVKFDGKDLYGEYDNYCIIDGYKEYKVQVQKPNLGYKDFLYHCARNWDNAEEDCIDKMLALQLVSCPSSFYGKGGIGAISSKISPYGKLSKSILSQLSSTYNGIISPNFQQVNDQYFFNLIKTSSDVNHINVIRKNRQCEVNYCRPCITYDDARITSGNIPIQIPMLIKNANYTKSDGLEEVYLLLQYQLTALMHYPAFGNTNAALSNVENNIRRLIEERMLENIFAIDSNTLNKLALSFCRLHLTDDVSDHRIQDAAEMFFDNWEDWKYYINNSESLTDFRNGMHATDIRIHLSRDHQRFLVELQKLHDETKEKWIDIQNLEERLDKKIRVYTYEIAKHLNDLGLIIQQNNFSKMHLVLGEI
ncbi:MAG: hypothetical protein OIN88_13445 [Candidatus Methanoperedens sp.]|nr:hypothetical protein [Candidatus Methanoperedens sp.]MCZ7361095.1 hypothetical protein [Candidatus Methanoperedens sp.]HLB72188.1 hypothetical protein [Candidatus Methanoperedens sp.]